MNELDHLAKDVSFLSGFKWTKTREQAALALAQGFTVEETAWQVGVADRTIYRWKNHPDFLAEVNRLSLMIDISNRAERLRIAMRVVRTLGYETNRDLLDWLKYAQGETDGVKLDLATLAEAMGLVADSGQAGMDSEEGTEASRDTE